MLIDCVDYKVNYWCADISICMNLRKMEDKCQVVPEIGLGLYGSGEDQLVPNENRLDDDLAQVHVCYCVHDI